MVSYMIYCKKYRLLDPSSKSEYEMKSRLLRNIVISQRTTVLKLLARKNQTLLIRGNALLVLNLALDSLNIITRFYVECNGLARKCLDEDLHIPL
jgi:hypothetical protein